MNDEPTNKEILDAILGNRDAIKGNTDAIKGNTDAIEMVARNLAQTEERLTKSLDSFKNKHDSEMDIVRDDIRVLKTKVGV